jgi:hypothetical protein
MSHRRKKEHWMKEGRKSLEKRDRRVFIAR